ncbi:MAG: hypothetical protein V8K32_07045 [Candidatus Electrothrix gigas]
MLKKELQEIIINGENSGVELKGDNMPVLRTDISCLDLVRLGVRLKVRFFRLSGA